MAGEGDLRRATLADAGAIVETLAAAFDGDPFFRWMFGPDECRFRRGVHAWLDLVVGIALPRGRAWLAGDGRGASVWLPPGVELAGPGELVLTARLLDELAGERAGEILGAIGASSGPVPNQPHWVCLYIGVVPAAQGSGLGGRLLQPGLAVADRAGVATHLVSTNPATAGFYERFGFRVLGEVGGGPGAPVLRPMWREPVAR